MSTNESYSFKLKSHPEKLLFDHLCHVGDLCKNTVAGKSLNVDDEVFLKEAAYIVGISHDLGKATSFFQDYIAETDEKRKRSLKAKESTHHGLLSAFFSYALVKQYISQSGWTGGAAEHFPMLAFLAVKRHHGNLLNAMEELSDVYSNKDKILQIATEQMTSIDRIEICEIITQLLHKENIDLNLDINDLINYIMTDSLKEITRKEKRFVRGLTSKNDIYPYFLFQFIYSTLLDADKTDAGLDGIDLERLSLSPDLVDEYRDLKGFSSYNADNADRNSINDLRNRIYEESINRINDWNLDDKILSLNVPTGTGKTLTALSLSLKLRSRLEIERKIKPRIIYALPFLSIIDQNYRVFDDVLAGGTKADVKDSRLLLKHHHLADIKYKTEDNEYDVDKSLLLLEGWNAEIIVTTFWQLFNTLFSNRNRQLRKFNKLINSIIILDEVQAVPHQYWLLIHDSLKMLCDTFNSYIVFITATQPLIFDEDQGEIKEIAQNKEEYYRNLNRIELIPQIESPLTLDEFKALLANDLYEKPDKDFLVVLNTISSAQDVYNFVRGLQLENTTNFFLSTNVIPKERLNRILKIKDAKKNKGHNDSDSVGGRMVIISTQLIEAGVDIDTDIVYRDFAPLDSINQVAGRCNRNFAKDDKGTVFVFRLKDDRKELYKYIYDSFLTEKTLDILKPIKGTIAESAILDLNYRYFKAVKRGMSEQESKNNLDFISGLAFNDLNKNFKLIEEDYPKIDVFVELDQDAVEIWKKYKDMQSEKDYLERTKRYLQIKKDLSEYIISAPQKYAHDLLVEDSSLGYISIDELSHYYDMETGFMRASAGEGSMII